MRRALFPELTEPRPSGSGLALLAFLTLLWPLAAADLPRFRWENFTTAQGLPDNRVYSVCVDGDRIWAGTDNGLALYERGKWRVFTPEDGLAHRGPLRDPGQEHA